MTQPELGEFLQKKKLSGKLLRVFLLVSLLPLLAVAWLSYQKANENLTQAAFDSLQQSSTLQIRFIENWFDYRLMDLLNQAESESNTRFLTSLVEGFHQSGLAIGEYTKSYDWAKRANAQQSDLINFLRGYDYIYDVFLVDAEGNVLFTVAKEDDLGTNLVNGAYAKTGLAAVYKQAILEGGAVFSGIERYAPSNDELAGFIAAPIVDNHAAVKGVFVVQLRLDHIFRTLEGKTSVHAQPQHYLVSDEGVLLSPIKNRWNEVLKRKVNLSTPVDNPNSKYRVKRYLGLDGKEMIGIHHLITVFNQRWHLISEVERDVALASNSQLAQIMAFLLLVSTFMVAIASYRLARNLSLPIVSLLHATRKLASGETNAHVDIQSDDEIGQLSHAFNQMLDSRAEYEQALKEQTLVAQKALKEVEEQRFAIDQHSILAITDVKGTITYANNKFCEISGYDPDEIIGQNHRMLKSGQHDTEFFRDMYKTIANGGVWHGVICNKAKDGHLYWVDSTIMPFMGENGKPRSYVAIRTDVSEMVKTQQELQESESRLGLVIEATEVGIWDWQVQTGQVNFNERWANICGYTLEELQPINIDTWLGLCHPEDMERSGEALSDHWQGKTDNYSLEVRMKHKNGHWVWVLDTGRLVERYDDGRPKRMIGTHLDITKRKLEEAFIEKQNAALADARRYIDGITNEVPALLAYVDTDFIYRFVNKSYERWFGQPLDFFKDRPVKDCVGEEAYKVIKPKLEAAVKGNRVTFETQVPYQGAGLRHVHTSYLPDFSKSGEVKGLFVSVEDISDAKENEVKLKQYTQELEAQKAQLIAARITAESSARAKSEFLACMSHEIRTPMNGVLGMLSLLSQSNMSDEQKHRVRLAQSSAKSLLTLINDILDFSKVEAGKLDLEILDFDLRHMLGEFAEGMASQAQEKGVELVLDISAVEVSRVEGDPGRIRQVLTNLVSNAIKFTEQGDVVIQVALSDYSDQQWKFHAQIIDSGIGIPEEKQGQLFDAFSQVDASTTRQYGGTGLGLAIVKRLCQLMHGDVTVRSKSGQGSTFMVDLLLGKSVSAENVVPPFDVSNVTAMVVDANKASQTALKAQLEKWGVTVYCADNEQKASRWCEQMHGKKDALTIGFVDMGLPKDQLSSLVNGYQQKPGDMVCVLMTPLNYRSDQHESLTQKVDGYFPKPATTEDIFNALSLLFKQGKEHAGNLHESYREKLADSLQPFPADARILLVEDNQVNQLVASGIADQLGLNLDFAADGVEALAALARSESEHPYTLVIMDCQMPNMDGYEATQRIRAGEAGERYTKVPVVAMTANAMQGDKEKCLAAGMSDYLSKPIDIESFERKVRQWLVDPVSAEENAQTEIATFTKNGDSTEQPKDWDQNAVLKHAMNNEKLMMSLIDVFLNEAPEYVDKLQTAVDKQDVQAVMEQAHSIKGMAGNLGGLALQKLAGDMEASARESDASAFAQQFDKLENAYGRLIDQLKAYLQQQR